MTEGGLPLLFIPRTKPTGILRDCTVMINLSRALNLPFYCETFCTKESITSAANRSLRLKLIPIGLSFWFSRFCIVIPTMSHLFRFCNAWRNGSNWLGNGSRNLWRQREEGGEPQVAYPWHWNVYTAEYLCPQTRICEPWTAKTKGNMCCITLKTIFANVITIPPLIWLLLTDVAPLYKYLHYVPLTLPSGNYNAQLISVRWLASLYIRTTYVMSAKARVYLLFDTSCHQKRAYNNDLHVATGAIAHDVTFTRIRLSV